MDYSVVHKIYLSCLDVSLIPDLEGLNNLSKVTESECQS